MSSVAEVLEVEGSAEIRRSDGMRVARITANLAGRDLGSVANAIEAEFESMTWPSGYDCCLGGQQEEMQYRCQALETRKLDPHGRRIC